MTQIMNITILVENTVRQHGLLAEHGLVYLLQIDSRKILFDTGQGNVLFNNARKLNISLENIDAIVLSHGHYDHTGGLNDLLQYEQQPIIYAHPEAFQPKFTRNANGVFRNVGMRLAGGNIDTVMIAKPIWTTKPTEIYPGIFVTGEIPRLTDFENTGGSFFIDQQCKQPDPLLDDQALFFNTPKGTVVLLGCAHAGVINTLKYIHELTDGRPIHAVIGGMHLVNASQQRKDRTIDALCQYNIDRLIPAHCTGMEATAQLWAAFPNKCKSCDVGSTFEFKVQHP